MKQLLRHRSASAVASRQRGVVLLFSLIALVVLLIAAVALMRSFNTSLFTSGNIAFKRDLQNQGERAVEKVLASFRTGALASVTARASSDSTKNYSARMLEANSHGIPEALQNDTFTTTRDGVVGVVTNDITPSNDSTLTNQGVSVRYVVDRMCNQTGDETTLGATSCILADSAAPSGHSSSNAQGAESAALCTGCKSASPLGVVYRLTVRVTGPRRTTAFFQSTFTIPS